MSLIVIIEREDGTTFEQEIPYTNTPQQSVKQFERNLGKDYMVVDWRLE